MIHHAAAGVGKIDAKNDPYVLHLVAMSAIDDQLTKENAQLDAVVSSQNNYVTLEKHIVQVLKQATAMMNQLS